MTMKPEYNYGFKKAFNIEVYGKPSRFESLAKIILWIFIRKWVDHFHATHFFNAISEEEQLYPEKLSEVIERYLFTWRTPLREQLVGMLKTPPKIRERKTIIQRLTDRIMEFVDTFEEFMGEI